MRDRNTAGELNDLSWSNWMSSRAVSRSMDSGKKEKCRNGLEKGPKWYFGYFTSPTMCAHWRWWWWWDDDFLAINDWSWSVLRVSWGVRKIDRGDPWCKSIFRNFFTAAWAALRWCRCFRNIFMLDLILLLFLRHSFWKFLLLLSFVRVSQQFRKINLGGAGRWGNFRLAERKNFTRTFSNRLKLVSISLGLCNGLQAHKHTKVWNCANSRTPFLIELHAARCVRQWNRETKIAIMKSRMWRDCMCNSFDLRFHWI